MPTLKEVKGDSVTDEPGVKRVRLRGVEYVVTELDVDQYDAAMKSAEDENGQVPLGKLLRAMVGMAVRPLPKGPFKFPVYRTLEGIVNDMHFQDVPDEIEAERLAAEAEAKKAGEDGESAAASEGEAAPNA